MSSFIPAYDKDGNIFGAVASSTNINEIKRAELKFKKQFEELQKTNHELDRFVYSVSHDLRAPLASILGLINLADMEKPSPVFGNYFALIRTSVNRLDGFIKDILDYSRNSRAEVTAEKIDFQKIVAEVQDNVRLMDGAARLKTELKIDNGFDFYSDRARVSILFNNLFSNAIKYQDHRKPVSTICIHVTLSLHQALIKFSDNGIGIAPEHLPKIFNMFYRASENSKGSGLGLYIANETLSKLGGTIKVESEPGLSTTFEITIPDSPPNK